MVVVVSIKHGWITWLDSVCEALVFGRGAGIRAIVTFRENGGTFCDGVLNGAVSVPCEVEVFTVGCGWDKTAAYVV